MDLLLVVLTAIGLGLAAGLRPFLPALLCGALAAGDLVLDFDATSLSFLEQPWFLVVVLALLAVGAALSRRQGAAALEAGPFGAATAGLSLGLGGALAAAAMDGGRRDLLPADGVSAWAVGLPLGIACAALSAAAVRSLFARVRSRSGADEGVSNALPLYADGAALVTALAALAFPPLALVALGFLAWLLLGGRRREGERYAGLRVLR